MPFTGKATYSAGPDLPEIAEDVSDIIGIVSPYETPLLDHLGDPARRATSTVHEWLEDSLLPNMDSVSDSSITDAITDTGFGVGNGNRFRPGDQVRAEDRGEVMLVTAVIGDTITVARGYGGTTPQPVADGDTLHILGNAALEGGDAPAPRFTTRSRRHNVTQIFTASVEVSGSQLAARQIGIDDELDYQKQERLRELIRDLENSVINGVSNADNPRGNADTRRTMRGILASLESHRVDAEGDPLTEPLLNQTLRDVWQGSAGSIDTIAVSGFQKRAINGFITAKRGYTAKSDTYRDMVSTYESDFGVCRVVLSRWVPRDAVLLLDSSRIDVLPLTGRSFHFKRLATTGDRETGQVIGEYTMELRNESAHAVIRNLGA